VAEFRQRHGQAERAALPASVPKTSLVADKDLIGAERICRGRGSAGG
jgi:hypothetical protein